MEGIQSLPSELTQNTQKPHFFKRATQGKSFLIIFILLGVLALGSGFFAYNTVRNDRDENSPQEVVQKPYISDNVMVYGYWVGDEAIIAVHSLKDGSQGILATLPTNVKHVKITSPTTFLYIADTDERDHGKTIKERDLETRADTVVFTADANFGIDDYAVSQKGKYLSIWEIKMPDDSEILVNGTSRVINLDVGSSQKYTIYEEVFAPSIPVHYPIGITDSGELFTDRFLPNSGAGWAYGMSRSNLTGTDKSDILSMKNGTYSSQPVMSADGKYIAFAGYSGNDGAVEVNGFRKALISPDSLEILKTATSVREMLQAKEENVLYSAVFWDQGNSNQLLFTKSLFDGESYVVKEYGVIPETKQIMQIIAPGNTSEKLYTSLTEGKYLFAIYDTSSDTLGNLGGKYSKVITNLDVIDSYNNVQTPVSTGQNLVQLIAVKPSAYFPSEIIKTAVENLKNQLQLETFVIKPELAPKREKQQSVEDPEEQLPLCREVASNTCNNQLGTDCKWDDVGRIIVDCDQEELFTQCYVQQQWDTSICYDSPLCLYGTVGQEIVISIGVPVYLPNVSYSPTESVKAIISENGKFYANGKLIEGFSFDYAPALKKISRPGYGKVVPRSDLEKTLKGYALNLGLNTKETNDLIEEAKTVKSNYQYVSFFDHETSAKILPLYFNPKPDTYRNIVFYIEEFSNKPNLNPEKPVFDPIVRNGLTAIEISVLKR